MTTTRRRQHERDDGFDEFVADLTGYLNSSDYLHDFMYDSLRLARELTAEAGALVSGNAATALNRTSKQAQEELERERARMSALDTLKQQNWDSAFEALRTKSEKLLEELTRENAEQVETACQEQIAAWMDSDESWNDLLEKRLNPQLEQEASRQSSLLLEHLREQMTEGHAGAAFSDKQLSALRDAGVQIEEVLSVKPKAPDTAKDAASLRMTVDPADVPVKRTLGDFLLFRSRAQVRQEVFGDDGNRSVSATVKRKRLGEASLKKLRTAARDIVAHEIPALQRRLAEEMVDAHVKACTQTLQQHISQSNARLQERITPMESKLRTCQQAQAIFERIKSSSARFESELSELTEQFDLSS